MSKQLAVMSKPHYGVRDTSHPIWWFDVKFGDDLGHGALIVLTTAQMRKIVDEAHIYDIETLHNRPCQVEVSTDNSVEFVKVLEV